jgi:mannose-6-phosphate isomerase-like protein (cupin superfamily)
MNPAPHSENPVPPIDLGGGVQVLLHLVGDSTQSRVSVVEHPMAPGSLIEPHTHEREDEYSFVLSGTLGMLLGDQEFEATPGMMVPKPRGVRHGAWNSGPAPARFLEIISPGGFEQFFLQLAELFSGDQQPSVDALEELSAGYGLSFHIELVNDLIDRHGLKAAVRY